MDIVSMLELGNWNAMLIALLITVALLSIPFIKMQRNGIPSKYCLVLILASLGTYSRILCAWTLFGIPVNRMFSRAAEVGWGRAANEILGNLKNSDTPDIMAEIKQIFADEEERNRKRKLEEAERRRNEKQVEVWRMNGMMRENLKVNSDNTMYYDPDDGEWKKIER